MDQRTFSKTELIAEITSRLNSLDNWDLCEVGEIIFGQNLTEKQFIGVEVDETNRFVVNIVERTFSPLE